MPSWHFPLNLDVSSLQLKVFCPQWMNFKLLIAVVVCVFCVCVCVFCVCVSILTPFVPETVGETMAPS